MGLNCPKCQSDQVQSINVIVTSGTSYTSGTVAGMGNGGVGVGTMGGISQTNLAARFSRPKGPTWFLTVWLSVGMILGAFLLAQWSIFASVVPLAVMVFFIRQDIMKAKEQKEKLIVWEKLYNHGFFCHKCGNIFTV